jgi:hypothetical protein
LRSGPPFDPAEAGLSGHAAYLTDDSVYLVFEGEAAHVKAMRVAREHVVEVSSHGPLPLAASGRVTTR